MADVHSRSYLSIAASRSVHCEDGFLRPRMTPPNGHIQVDGSVRTMDIYVLRQEWIGTVSPFLSG